MKPLPVAVFSASILLAAGAEAEVPLDFSGMWTAKGATDAASPSAHDGMHGRDGGMSGRHGGMGGRRHGGARSTAAGDRTAAAGPDAVPRARARALTIRQSDVVFDIAADGGTRMVYRFDNRNNYGPAYGGTVSLNWSAPEMVIETHRDAGGSVEERYSLSADGKQLTLKIHELPADAAMGGSGSAHDITRVFAREGVAGAAGLP